jgi:hypothetical protein|nr:MAG TPA: hypothetical protein [Caudoviricetes sp.]
MNLKAIGNIVANLHLYSDGFTLSMSKNRYDMTNFRPLPFEQRLFRQSFGKRLFRTICDIFFFSGSEA